MKQTGKRLLFSLLFFVTSSAMFSQGGDPVSSTDSLFRLREDAPAEKIPYIDLEIARYHLMRDLDSLTYYVKLLEDHISKNYDTRIDAFIKKFLAYKAYNELKADSSIDLNRQALLLFEEVKDFREMGWISMNIAENYFRLGDFPAATEAYLEGLAYFEKAEHKRGIAEAYNGLGRISYQTEQFDKARDYFEAALEIFNELGNELQSLRVYNNLGILMLDNGETRKALDNMFIAEQGFRTIGDVRLRALVFGNIAIAYDDLGKRDSAMLFSRRALNLSRQTEDDYGIIAGLINLGYFKRISGDYDSSRICFKKALELSKARKMTVYEEAIYQEYSDLYAEIGDYRTAFHYNLMHDSINDLISDEKSEQRIDELMFSYKQRLKEKELMQLKADQKMQKRINNIFILLIFLALSVVLVLIYAYRRNQSQRSQLQEKNDLLSKYNLRLEKSEEELKLLNSEKNKLFSIVAHDLRNPVAAVSGFTELLVDQYDELDDETRKEYIEQIAKGSLRTLNLLENLLLWARSQMDLVKVKKTDISAVTLIEESVGSVRTAADKKGIEIYTEVSDDITLHVDTEMIKAVLRNLITNAIKFSYDNGRIDIVTSQSDRELCISIKDSGVGINRKTLKNLFSADIVTSSDGTDHEPGSGLGLLISKDYTEKNGGHIRVKSVPGKGSVFTICFPQQ